MVKRKKKLEKLSYNKLYQATGRTLDKMKREKGWKIEKEDIEDKRRSWIVKAYLKKKGAFSKFKKLIVEVEGKEVTLHCFERWPSLALDPFNEKKRIVNQFLKELEKEIKESS